MGSITIELILQTVYLNSTQKCESFDVIFSLSVIPFFADMLQTIYCAIYFVPKTHHSVQFSLL